MEKNLLFFILVFGFNKSFGSRNQKPILLSNCKNDLNAVAISPTKFKRMAIGGWDNDILVYQTDTPYKMVQRLVGHTAAINAITYNYSGNMLASASGDNSVRVYDSMYRYIPFVEDMLNRHLAPVSCLTFDRTGKYLFSGDKQGKLMIWDVLNKKPIKYYSTPNAINDICLTPNNANLFIAHADKQIKVIALAGGATVRTLDGHSDIVNVLALSPNNQFLISGSNDKTARIWDLKTWKQIHILQVESWKVTAVAFTDDSKYCVTGCNDGSIKVWELASGKLVSTSVFPDLNIRDIAFTKNSQMILFAPKLKEEGEYGARLIPSLIPSATPITPVKSTLNPQQKPLDSMVAVRPMNKQDSIKFKNNLPQKIVEKSGTIKLDSSSKAVVNNPSDSIIVTKTPIKAAPRRRY